MKYFDKNFAKWQRKQETKQADWFDDHHRQKRQELKKFALKSFIDKEWWRILSWDEREKVMSSYYDTQESAQRKFKGDDDTYTWYSYSADVTDVTGKDWLECIPQWVEYVMQKYPLDANVRRDLAIRRIFS